MFLVPAVVVVVFGGFRVGDRKTSAHFTGQEVYEFLTGRVRSGGFQILTGRVGSPLPDPTRLASFDPTREFPWKLRPTTKQECTVRLQP